MTFVFRETLSTLSALAFSMAAYAQDVPPDNPPNTPPEYADPGPAPTRVVQQIIDGLRTRTPDIYSIRDFSLCQEHTMAARPDVALEGNGRKTVWKRAQRVVLFRFSAKNEFGGYNGFRDGIASFEGGKLVEISSYQASDNEPPRQTAWRGACRAIPTTEVQAAARAAP